jgi:hypothetical protein
MAAVESAGLDLSQREARAHLDEQAPADYRVAEVRLLHDVIEVGETRSDRRRASDNLLIRGDVLKGSLEEARDGLAPLPATSG